VCSGLVDGECREVNDCGLLLCSAVSGGAHLGAEACDLCRGFGFANGSQVGIFWRVGSS